MKLQDKQALKDWEAYEKGIFDSTTVDINETTEEKAKRIKRLEADPEAWFVYYFPKYSYADPAPFHIKATKRLLNAPKKWYEVRAWSRELAKSARCMFETIYQAMTGKVRNVMLISHSNDQAVELLKPYKINFETNQRLINDYGTQKNLGDWTDDFFITTGGVSFKAVGAGQSPRGSRNAHIRVEKIIFDDIDTDEEGYNVERIKKKWRWIERAVMPTVSVSGMKQFVFLGNIIAKDTCITRAKEKADHFEVINIRDKNEKSTWAKNSEEDIEDMLSTMGYASQQQEFYNNPIPEGATFESIVWGKIPRIDSFDALCKYGDPGYTDKTKTKGSSMKGVVLGGKKDGKIYIFTCRLDKATNAKFVSWYNNIKEHYSHDTVQQYDYVENNSLQDPFFQQVLKPEFKRQNITIKTDGRSKPDKFFRVDGNLAEPVADGDVIFNIKEKDNPHMKRLEDQFIAFSEFTAKKLDGPDMVEGLKWILDNKIKTLNSDSIQTGGRRRSKKKF